jgi:hypothetical protein
MRSSLNGVVDVANGDIGKLSPEPVPLAGEDVGSRGGPVAATAG